MVRLSVTINGVQGNMVLDTGATFVSLTGAFAQKAKVQIDQDSVIHIRTANGVVEGKRGRAAKIQLRSLQAKDVPVVVDISPKASYGEGIDGLLGMSFLSHFKFSIDAQALGILRRPRPLGLSSAVRSELFILDKGLSTPPQNSTLLGPWRISWVEVIASGRNAPAAAAEGMSKHVAVLMGGWSAEREVSLRSGKACAGALERPAIV